MDIASGDSIPDMMRRKDTSGLLQKISDYRILDACTQECSHYVETALSHVNGRVPPVLEEDMREWAEAHRTFKR
jgi:hypothetical protein